MCLTITFLLLSVSGSGQAASKASLSKKSVKLKMGKTTTLKVRHASRKVRWSTTNKKIARIKKRSGKRKQKVVIKAGKKAGTCYIKAKIGKKTLKCKVTVKKKKITLKAGKSYAIKAKINKIDETKILLREAHGPAIRYRSSNTKIAKVSSKGKITAKAPGKCKVYVYAINGVSKTIRVTVKEK